jgi:hypothetical protein
MWPKTGTILGIREHDIEPSGYINDREFLDQLTDYQLLKKDSAPYNLLLNLGAKRSSYKGCIIISRECKSPIC